MFVTRFQTTETTGFAKERIVTEIALQTRLKGAGAAPFGAFDVGARSEARGLDTTDSADNVVRGALLGIERNFARALAARARLLPAPPFATQAAVPTRTSMPQRLRVQARRMSAEDEVDLFEDRLTYANLIPIHVDIELIEAGAPVTIRRDSMRLEFSEGASANAVDARKAQELVRTSSGVGLTIAFAGAAGAAIAGAAIDADRAARKQVRTLALDLAVLAQVGARLSGLVFFSRRNGVPRSLSIELLDPAGQSEQLVIQLPRT